MADEERATWTNTTRTLLSLYFHLLKVENFGAAMRKFIWIWASNLELNLALNKQANKQAKITTNRHFRVKTLGFQNLYWCFWFDLCRPFIFTWAVVSKGLIQCKIPNNWTGKKKRNKLVWFLECKVKWGKKSHLTLNQISYKNRRPDKKLSSHWPPRGSQDWILTSTATEMIVKTVFSNFQPGSFLFYNLRITEDIPKTRSEELSEYESRKTSSKFNK